MQKNSMEVHEKHAEPWRVTLIDTGEGTMTGGRLKRIAAYLNNGTFCMTYGDGLGNVDITEAISSHKNSGKKATITAVRPPGRFGLMEIEGNVVRNFIEKPDGYGGWINGGYFVLEPSVLDHIPGDDTSWEQGPLQSLAVKGQLHAYQHRGFWQPMDTLREKRLLEDMWNNGNPPWFSR